MTFAKVFVFCFKKLMNKSRLLGAVATVQWLVGTVAFPAEQVTKS